MSETAIRATVPTGEAAAPAPGDLPARPISAPKGSPWRWLRRSLEVAASLRITVVLFSLAILLIFFGTLAQVDEGIWMVVSKYFRCFFAWIPLKIFFPRDMRQVPGSFPFPGGWTIAALLLVNLLAAHSIRFRLTWKRSGIMILHAGLIIMIAGEFITGMFAAERSMSVFKGKSANYVADLESVELAFVAPIDDKTEHAIVVPGSLLRKDKKVSYEGLPFDIVVEKYMANSDYPLPPAPSQENPATAGVGLQRITIEKPATNGVDPDGKVDCPAAYLTFVDRQSGQSLGTYLFSTWFDQAFTAHEPQPLQVDGRTYQVALRFKRTYTPYSVRLHDVKTEFYPGSTTPRSFESRIDMVDPRHDVDREVTISMNAPLRYDNQTFYQAGVLGTDQVTRLQVVRNPGWLLPYVSCITVGLGMLIHFGIKLTEFLRRRAMA